MLLILFLVFLASVWLSGFLTGVIITLRKTTKHLKEQNDLLEKQNKIIADHKRPEDEADWWKPKDWKSEWEPGDA